MLSTAVPVTHAEPIAPPPLAAAALAAALREPEARLSPNLARWARRITAAADDVRPLCSPAMTQALDAFTAARLGENASEDDTSASEHERIEALWSAAVDTPALTLGDVAAKVALGAEVENGGAALRRERAKEIVAGGVDVEPDLYAAAHAYLDLHRLATADAGLVAQGREALRLLAIYSEAEAQKSVAWDAWFGALPPTPDELKVIGLDHLLLVPGLASTVFWGTSQIEALRAALPGLRERVTTCHPDSQLPQALARAERLVVAHDEHEAAKVAPEHVAAVERFQAAQAVASSASGAAELVEDAVRAAPVSTVAGLAAKARLLLRSYTRTDREETPETWTEQVTRTFLEQVIAADEATS